ncbi:MAG: hypothetical protein ACRDWV_06635 [Acidimicrobiales bacterium]
MSCADESFCLAVGSADADNSAPGGLVDTGGSWTSTGPGKYPSGAILSGVSCPRTAACWAAGKSGAPDATSPYAEHYQNGRWSQVSTPKLTGGLDAVSCASNSDCVAVGYRFESDNRGAPLMERWNGRHWSVMSGPSLGGNNTSLTGVSCPTASTCFADGYIVKDRSGPAIDSGEPFVERYNGYAWSVSYRSTKAGVGVMMGAIACPGTSSCTAVGTGGTAAAGEGTFVLALGPHGWSTPSSAQPDSFPSLEGVACANNSACYAVGGYNLGPGSKTLILHKT